LKIGERNLVIPQSAICNLQSSISLPCAVSPRVRNDSVAQQERASSSPSRFSRAASLLYRAAARPRGRSIPNRKTNREKLLREKHEISSGGIIRILGHGIKVGWRG
jgi:hypothetical protein